MSTQRSPLRSRIASRRTATIRAVKDEEAAVASEQIAALEEIHRVFAEYPVSDEVDPNTVIIAPSSIDAMIDRRCCRVLTGGRRLPAHIPGSEEPSALQAHIFKHGEDGSFH